MASSVELSSARCNMTWLQESVKLAQHQLTNDHSALSGVEGKCYEYFSRLGIEAQWRRVLEALLRGVCSH